jgi:hypothetical protein
MKTNLLLLSLVLAATAALSLAPVRALAASGDIITVAGILTVFFIDYGRSLRPRRTPGALIAFDSPAPTPAGLREAA